LSTKDECLKQGNYEEEMKSRRKANSIALYKRLLAYLLPHRYKLFIVVVCTVVVSFLSVVNWAAFLPAIEIFFGTAEDKGERIVQKAARSGTEEQGTVATSDQESSKTLAASALERKQKLLERLAEKYAWAAAINRQYDKFKEKRTEIKQAFYRYAASKSGRINILLAICGFIIMIELLKFLFTYLSEYTASRVGLTIIRDLKAKIYRHVLDLDMSFFSQKTTGHLMTRISGDINGVSQAMMLLFTKVTQAPIKLVFTLGFLFILNVRLTLYALLFVPATIFAVRFFGTKVRKLSRKERKKITSINSAMMEILSGIKIVKAFRMEDYEMEKFDVENKKHFDYLLRRKRVKIITSPFMDVLGAVGVAFIILVGSYLIEFTATIDSAKFFLYLFVLTRIYSPVKEIEKANEDIQEGLANAERIFALLDTKRQIVEAPDAVDIPTIRENIVFRDVWFQYVLGHPVLRNINLEIKGGTVVAFVGPSGAGKSTLVSLIPRFYDPMRGSIEIDGVDLRKVTLDSLRGQIGIVSQESVLFNDTVRSNIAYGQRDIDDEKVVEAAKAAHIHDFIMSLPRGYDSVIGERGTRVSGGERQRLTIARALYKDPAILMFDEATSSLDTESERLIQKAVDKLLEGRTTLMIAHRLSTIMHADEIVVMNRGEIVERGTHYELMALNGLYAHLCKQQFHFAEVGTGGSE
jgi:subfamily B ATP-binding cassette protein MsbA